MARTLRGARPARTQAAFYTSGRTSNEAAFLYQLFVRAFGTNNLPDCSNMCHESSGAALTETIGIGKGSVTLDDIHAADLIIVVGQNPGTNHPRMLTALERAKRNGARIIAVNPLPEAGLLAFRNPQTVARPGRLGHRPGRPLPAGPRERRPGPVPGPEPAGSIERDARSTTPSSTRTAKGFDALVAHLRDASWPELLEASGLVARRHRIGRASSCCRSKRMIVCWAMGLTQHRNSVATIREIVNLLLLRGSIGRPGAGLCPVRGHSNVQGDRTMGIWEQPGAGAARRARATSSASTRRASTASTSSTRSAPCATGGCGRFVALGGNFLSATPDTAVTAAALAGCELTVHVSTKLNRSHLHPGRQALILPCLGRTEVDRQRSGPQFVTRRGLDERGAPVAGSADARPRRTC